MGTHTISAPSRRQGWWGVAFVVVLLVEVVMVSLPTSDKSGDRIKAFYEAHRQIIIAQQIIGALALVPFLAFVIALDRRARAAGARWVQWLIPAGMLLAACEVDVRLRQIPILVVSAYGDPTGVEVDFLSKPVNVSRLLRSLDKITGAAPRAAAR